jgi:hypothetical protein
VETTERRVCYYGFVLGDIDTLVRLVWHCVTGDYCPQEAEQVRRFSRSFFDKATAEEARKEVERFQERIAGMWPIA